MSVYKATEIKKTRFADDVIEKVSQNKYKELEQIKVLLRDILKHSKHMQNKRLIEKWIVELEKVQDLESKIATYIEFTDNTGKTDKEIYQDVKAYIEK